MVNLNNELARLVKVYPTTSPKRSEDVTADFLDKLHVSRIHLPDGTVALEGGSTK